MDKQRAQQIIESPATIRVTYDGVPIYIQHVDEQTEMARIYPLNDPEMEKSVSVTQLNEE
ncbi:H-type small acid-soluble spore protein [Bacillaceae bacterium S4-13-58]